MRILLLVIVVVACNLNLSYAFYDQFVLDRFGLDQYVLGLSDNDISKVCKSTEKKCIWKCCPTGQIMERFKTCLSTNETLTNSTSINITNVEIYDKYFNSINESLQNVFEIVPGLMNDQIFAMNSLWWYKAQLIENGRLFIQFPNVYNRWKEIEVNRFCVEMKLNNSNKLNSVFMVEYQLHHYKQPNSYKKWSLIVAIICLILTLIMYALLPQLQNQNGIVLMIHFICLTANFIINCILENYDSLNLRLSNILAITFSYYFTKMCAICWTNVIFYRVLRNEFKSASFIRELIKYCVYSFGMPLFMTIMVATIEFSDMSDTPSFVTPQIVNKGNFTFNEKESLYYIYIPVTMLLGINWSVCFVKVYKHCSSLDQIRFPKEPDTEEETYLNRPIQFVKYLVLLTFNVLLDMLTVLHPSSTHDLAATFTLCMGLIIMAIFLWKQLIDICCCKGIETYFQRPLQPKQ